MVKYQNRSGNSPITHYLNGNGYIVVRFNTGKDYTYSYAGKAGKLHVDNMQSLAVSGAGLSAYITRNVKFSYD